jgi:hypothetical protein
LLLFTFPTVPSSACIHDATFTTLDLTTAASLNGPTAAPPSALATPRPAAAALAAAALAAAAVAACFRRGSNRFVSRKGPKWWVAIWSSKPSTEFEGKLVSFKNDDKEEEEEEE